MFARVFSQWELLPTVGSTLFKVCSALVLMVGVRGVPACDHAIANRTLENTCVPEERDTHTLSREGEARSKSTE